MRKKNKTGPFNEIATNAAKLEKSGDNYGARIEWLKALAYPSNEMNRDWCQAMAAFCGSMRWSH